MMHLIAESGSTKTHWKGTENGKPVLSFSSDGLNPFVQSGEQIKVIIKTEVATQVKDADISQIFFYGAGCSNEKNNTLMYSCLKSFFHKAEIKIEHDLLGAARGLWGHNEGLVCILGTGSNSCLYNGKEIIEDIPALGYVLGDEGGGAYLGKRLVRDYLYKQMPEELSEKLRLEYQLDKDKILQRVYQQANPNRWLASFSIFIRDNFNLEYCRQLVRNGFQDFFNGHINYYSHLAHLPLGSVGSIGFLYQDILAEVSEVNGFHLEKIIRSPMDELVLFHAEMQDVNL